MAIWGHNSMEECLFCTQEVVGSNPTVSNELHIAYLAEMVDAADLKFAPIWGKSSILLVSRFICYIDISILVVLKGL